MCPTGSRECRLNCCCSHRSQKTRSWASEGNDMPRIGLWKISSCLEIHTWDCTGTDTSCLYLMSRQACDRNIQPCSTPPLLWKKTPKNFLNVHYGAETSTVRCFTRVLSSLSVLGSSSPSDICVESDGPLTSIKGICTLCLSAPFIQSKTRSIVTHEKKLMKPIWNELPLKLKGGAFRPLNGMGIYHGWGAGGF